MIGQQVTVADLVYFLQQRNPAATVVLWDHAPNQGRLSKLGIGELRPIQLGARECNGLLPLFESPADEDDDGDLAGTLAGVILGSN